MDYEHIRKYIDKLATAAKKQLSKSLYKDGAIDLNEFGYINTAIVNKAIQENLNLHIRTFEKEDNKDLYIPVLLSIFISGFLKNYIDYNPEPHLGEIVQKDKKRYTVKAITKEQIIIENQAEGLWYPLKPNQYREYIITTATKETNGRKLTDGFEHYRNFFDKVIKDLQKEVMPSKFQHKYLIITSKEIYDYVRKEVQLEDIKIYKSLPIRYIASSGKATDSIPIDPMVYIVNDYQTAEKYLLNDKSNIETIIVIGDSKYRDYITGIAGDIRAERIKNAIFVGSEPISTFENIYRWNWTKAEDIALKEIQEPQIFTTTNCNISESIEKFQEVVETAEKEYQISISKDFSEDLWTLSRLVIPNSASRLNNKLNIIRECFKNKAETTINDVFNEEEIEEDPEVVITKITDAYFHIIDSITYEKWNICKPKLDKSYLIVPKDQLDEIKASTNKKTTETLLYSQFTKLKRRRFSKVCFFSVYGKSHYENTCITDECQPFFFLYPHEKEYLEHLAKTYKNEVQKEFTSKDRDFLSGVKYLPIITKKSNEEKLERLIASLEEDAESSNQSIEHGSTTHLTCKLTFSNGEESELDTSTSVLLCNSQNSISTTVDKLRIGDTVRIYANVNKDTLWDIALKNDKDGLFQQINTSAKLWKTYLIKYKEDNHLTLQELYNTLSSNGLTQIKKQTSIERWIDINSDLMFPASNKNLWVIKKTIRNIYFDRDFKNILLDRSKYRGIMISLGRDLSEEINTYIQSNGTTIGKHLSKFDENVRRSISDSNAPIRIITKITYQHGQSDEE